MNEITQTPKERAALLDCRIKANSRTAAESLVAIGRDLKALRDEKLYIELGFETFEKYCNEKVHISQRNAYNFIKAYDTYGDQLTSIQYLGITKLLAMTTLEPEDRQELIESGEAERLSTRELEKRVEELQNKNEQLTMELEEEKSKPQESEAEILLKKQNEELSKELEALKSVQSRQATDEEKEKLKSEVELLKKQKSEIAEAEAKKAEKKKEEAVKKAEENFSKETAEAEKKHAEEITKLKKQLAEAEKKAALQAPAKISAPDTQKERVKFYCEECLSAFNSAVDAAEKVEDDEAKAKCKQALRTIVSKMKELIQ